MLLRNANLISSIMRMGDEVGLPSEWTVCSVGYVTFGAAIVSSARDTSCFAVNYLV